LYDRLPWSASLLLRGYRKYHLGPISAAWEVGRTIPLGLAIMLCYIARPDPRVAQPKEIYHLKDFKQSRKLSIFRPASFFVCLLAYS